MGPKRPYSIDRVSGTLWVEFDCATCRPSNCSQNCWTKDGELRSCDSDTSSCDCSTCRPSNCSQNCWTKDGELRSWEHAVKLDELRDFWRLVRRWKSFDEEWDAKRKLLPPSDPDYTHCYFSKSTGWVRDVRPDWVPKRRTPRPRGKTRRQTLNQLRRHNLSRNG